MPIVYPPKLNTPEVLKSTLWGPLSKIGFQWQEIYKTPQTWAPGLVGFSIFRDGKFHTMAANCYLETFTRNCGVRSITGLNMSGLSEDLRPFFLQCVEELLRYFGYSVILASDGESNGYELRDTLNTYSSGWTVVPLGENQRMTKMSNSRKEICLMHKFLDWKQPHDIGVNFKNAEQTS